MSLIRQLWLFVIATSLLAFGGSLVVTTLSFRNHLEQQLTVKNIDNATVMAMTLTQSANDPVERELAIAAQFDSGHYELIRLTAPDGRVLVERAADAANSVPGWLVRLVPLRPKPGTAQVSSGWQQIGTLTVASHSRYAYASLWLGALELALWFALAGTATGLAGVWLLRRISKPLRALVDQVEEVGRRRFVTIAEPSVPELRAVAAAMNVTVLRLKAMFEAETQRLEALRREANHDPLTGLATRAHYLNRLQYALEAEDAPAQGWLAILRVADLAGINRRYGRAAADEYLSKLGRELASRCSASDDVQAGRLNGADFVLNCLTATDARAVAEVLLDTASTAASGFGAEDVGVTVGVARYQRGDDLAGLVARCDEALAAAEASGAPAWREAPEDRPEPTPHGSTAWDLALRGALDAGRLRLAEFAVRAASGAVIHLERPARLQLTSVGEWLPAAAFMPMAIRLGLSGAIDLAVVREALGAVVKHGQDVAVNIAAASLTDAAFAASLATLLLQHGDAARRLWLEVPEHGAYTHFEAFCRWRNLLRPSACRIGLEHVGPRFSEIGRLDALGIDYLKVDAAYVRGIDTSSGNQAFLKGLTGVAHGIGLIVIAEGVGSAAQLQALKLLGFDAFTGPAIETAG